MEYYSYFPWGLLVVLFHTYLIITLLIGLGIMGTVVMVFLLYGTLAYTRELSLKHSGHATTDSLRQPENLIKAFRGVTIVLKLFSLLLGPFVLFFHALCSIVPIYASFILIWYGSRLEWVESGVAIAVLVASIGFWMTVLQGAKYFCIGGAKTLRSWNEFSYGQDKQVRIMMKKFRLSCCPLAIGYGKTFKLERITQFIYIKGIVRGIMKTALTLPNT